VVGEVNDRSVYVAESPSPTERRILGAWLHGKGGGLVLMPHPRSPRSTDPENDLAALLAGEDNPLLTPLRVVWLPKERDGERSARLRDVVLGDPRHPGKHRQRWLRRAAPDRYCVVEGEPAHKDELHRRYTASTGPDGAETFPQFVSRQATVALERAEYRVIGAHYKVPRLVREDIVGSVRFRAGIQRLAADLDQPETVVQGEAMACLDEMVAGYSRFLLDLMVQIGRRVYKAGYDEKIDYDATQVTRVRASAARHPIVVLPSHKSHLDGLVVPVALHENGLPRSHTFAGINMAFGPLGAMWRRTGRVFIRRETKGSPVYRWVLREYISYLVEKRFSLEWYIEGTRSRSGKLSPPKLGLLAYVVDAYRDGRTEDVALLPVSVIYDQLHEVADFSAEARGNTKRAESMGWMLKFLRGQRSNFGKIYVRFGEPLSVREALGPGGGPAGTEPLALQKLAFEVCWRVNQVTPVTATAAVCHVLLAAGDTALTLDEVAFLAGTFLGYARGRGVPLAASAGHLDNRQELAALLASLASNRTIHAYLSGPEPVYTVRAGQHLSAAFYRNTIIHHFVEPAIAELSLLHAATREEGRVEAFWDEALRLRDILKFDFFFQEKHEFRVAMGEQLDSRLPDWERRLADGDDPTRMLEQLQPLHAFAVLRSFVEAYWIVGRALLRNGDQAIGDERDFVRGCLALGEQLVLQQRVRSAEAVSKPLFVTGLQYAASRHLTAASPDIESRRQAFDAEIGDLLGRLDVIEERGRAWFLRNIRAEDTLASVVASH